MLLADTSFFGSCTIEAWAAGIGTFVGIAGLVYGINKDRSISAGDRTLKYHEIVKELTSPEFRFISDSVSQALTQFPDIIARYRNRTPPTRDNIDHLFLFWDRVGSLVKHRHLDEGQAMPTLAYGCYVCWEQFQPLLDGYRALDKQFLSGFVYLHKRSELYLRRLGQLPEVEHAQVL